MRRFLKKTTLPTGTSYAILTTEAEPKPHGASKAQRVRSIMNDIPEGTPSRAELRDQQDHAEQDEGQARQLLGRLAHPISDAGAEPKADLGDDERLG